MLLGTADHHRLLQRHQLQCLKQRRLMKKTIDGDEIRMKKKRKIFLVCAYLHVPREGSGRGKRAAFDMGPSVRLERGFFSSFFKFFVFAFTALFNFILVLKFKKNTIKAQFF